ncbi:hypothetical protein ACFLQX_00260 [Bacteroidota bacterium]
MSNREEIISQAVARFKEIQTLDAIKASKDDIAITMARVLESGVVELRTFLENIDTLSKDEQKIQGAKFQEESFMFPPEFMAEMERLDGIPGGNEYLEEFADEMDKVIDPYIDEYSKLGEKLMNVIFGEFVEGMEDLMGGMADAVGGMAEGMMGDLMEEPAEPEFVFDYDNPNTPRMMYELYAAREWDDLDKDLLIDDMEEQLQNDIWELETLTDEAYGAPKGDDLERISDMRARMDVLNSEMDKEFARLGAKSDKAEEAESLKKEILSKLSLKVKEIKYYLAKLK